MRNNNQRERYFRVRSIDFCEREREREREREIERWEIPGHAGERERERGHWPGEGNGEGARMAGRFRLEEMVGGDWRAGVGDGERKIGNR
jgi:hypothetical protein